MDDPAPDNESVPKEETGVNPADFGWDLTQAEAEAEKAVGASTTLLDLSSLTLQLTQKWQALIAKRPPMKTIA